MRISVCVGDYAKIPYHIAGLELSVYCMEELCFCIRENAFLLDTSLMNDGLVNWIDRDCGLPGLARELYFMVHKKGSLSAFVTMLLEYTGLYDGETVKEICRVLKRGAGLSSIEKRKSQIDYLVQKKKYAAAVKGYSELLSRWEETETEEAPEGRRSEGKTPAGSIRAAILHNMGVACAGLMLYGQAAECFLQACGTGGGREEFQSYLAAKRMELSQEEYIAFAAELENSCDDALQLERRLEEISLDWRLQPEFLRLTQRKEARAEGDVKQYQMETGQALSAMKESYRSSAGD